MSPNAIRTDALDDRALVAAAQDGDRSAMDALLRRHHDRVHAVCRRITGNDADALDATQEALIAITRGIGRFDGTSAFTTWAYRVATNASLDELRRRRRRPEPRTFSDRRAGWGSDGDADDSVTLVDAAVPIDDRIALRIDVDHALGELAPDFRAAVVLRDLCGLDYSEIAEILKIPGGTVRSRIARGRAALLPLMRAGNPIDAAERPRSADV